MYVGIFLCFVGAFFGLVQYKQTKALPVHSSMSNVSHTIWETCKTYLFQQGKFLVILWVLIAACMFFYFKVLEEKSLRDVAVILAAPSSAFSAPTRRLVRHPHQHVANSRTSFSALKGNPFATLGIPLRSGIERRSAARLRGIVLHDLHPGLPQGPRRPVLHWLRHRRIPRRLRPRICGGIFSPRSPTSAPT